MGIVPQIVHEKPGESPVPRCFIENRARWVRNCAWAQMQDGPKSGVFGACRVHKSTWRWVFAWLRLEHVICHGTVSCCLFRVIWWFWDMLGPQKYLEVGVWLRLERFVWVGPVAWRQHALLCHQYLVVSSKIEPGGSETVPGPK